MSVVRIPPQLTQPPQLAPYSTHLTSLHCKSSGVKDFRRKWGNAAPAILFQTLKTLASPKLSLVTALCAGKRIVPAFSGVSFEVLKGKSDRRFSGEMLLLCRKFTWQSPVTAWHWISGSKKLHQLGVEFTPAKSLQCMGNKMVFHTVFPHDLIRKWGSEIVVVVEINEV